MIINEGQGGYYIIFTLKSMWTFQASHKERSIKKLSGIVPLKLESESKEKSGERVL